MHTENDDVFGRQRKKQERQRHQYEVANKYVFKCRLKVDSDDDDVTNDGKRRQTFAFHHTCIALLFYRQILVRGCSK